MCNMIRYVYGTQLDCPQHTVNIYTFNGQYFRYSWTKLYRFPSLYKKMFKYQPFIIQYTFLFTVFIVMHQNTNSNDDYLAKNVMLIWALVCLSYMPGQYTVQTQIIRWCYQENKYKSTMLSSWNLYCAKHCIVMSLIKYSHLSVNHWGKQKKKKCSRPTTNLDVFALQYLMLL